MFVRLLGLLAGVSMLIVAATAVQAVEPKDLVGKYDVVTTLANGNSVSGTAEITFEKGKSLKITWHSTKRSDIGIGRLKGDTLSVTYQRAKVNTQGKAEYTVQKDGSLVGTFDDSKGVSGKETLTPKK